jgi:hypothetical protein
VFCFDSIRKPSPRDFAVPVLRTILGSSHLDTSRDVAQSHGRVGLVAMLTTGTRCLERRDTYVAPFDRSGRNLDGGYFDDRDR